MIRKSIQKIAATGFVRSAMEEQADLSAFKEKPGPRIIFGLMAIMISYIIGWPAVAALGIQARGTQGTLEPEQQIEGILTRHRSHRRT